MNIARNGLYGRSFYAKAILIAFVLLLWIVGPAGAADLGYVNGTATLPVVYGALEDIFADDLSHPEALALFAIGEEAFTILDPELFTGYSVKNEAQFADYDLTRTVRYGHADDWHLVELIALLRHHGFNPKVSVESRVSSYVHYYEWGQPDDGVKVTPIDDEKAYIYVKEYDALFQFDDADATSRLDDFLLRYAQKLTGQEDRHDLIRGSWYVPLYSVPVAQSGYQPLKEVRVLYGDHYLTNFVLPEHIDTIVDGLRHVAGTDYPVEVHDVWVNDAFYEYLGGTIVQ